MRRDLTESIEAIEAGHYLTGGAVQAEIWQSDPWVDLTHQEEFFSSASLRGVKWFGRGPKGRLGTLGYLRNASISSLDFRTRKGRTVRARLGAATEPRFLTRAVAWLRLETLWIVTGSALGCTLWMMWHVSAVAFGGFALLAALGTGAHLLIQRRSLREPAPDS